MTSPPALKWRPQMMHLNALRCFLDRAEVMAMSATMEGKAKIKAMIKMMSYAFMIYA